jgi:threonyl-tRNA synthetase
MSSDQADSAKAAEVPNEQSLPSRPAKQPKEKQPKEKSAKGGKSSGLEVCAPPLVAMHCTVSYPISKTSNDSYRWPSPRNSSSTDLIFSTRSRPARTPKSLVRDAILPVLATLEPHRIG